MLITIQKGAHQVILIIEDSAGIFQVICHALYTVMEQTRNLIERVSTDELYKVLKLRARPKILLALQITRISITQFIISTRTASVSYLDMRFPKTYLHDTAGFDLIKHIKKNYQTPSVLSHLDLITQDMHTFSNKFYK